MRSIRALLLRLGGLFRKDRREQELAAEMESHLQMHIGDNLRGAMSPTEARREALMKLGGVEQTKEIYPDSRGLPLFGTLFHDPPFAPRVPLKNPSSPSDAALRLAVLVDTL